MISQKEILVIVEGEKTEQAFLKSIENAFSLKFSVIAVKGNIYLLYKDLESLCFNADIKQVMLNRYPEYADILSHQFTYTYLIFDLDAHHTKRDDSRSFEEIFESNINKAKVLAKYFTDETDPTIGRIYINYPMMESFRDCDAFFEPTFKEEYCELCAMKDFKTYVNKKKLSGKHIDKYTQDDFQDLIKMHVYKLNHIMNNQWNAMPYKQYLGESEASHILDRQIKISEEKKQIAVINTSLFLILDYFGNRDGFYDTIVGM